ncbi:hypothetical protein HYPSUDRAFT_32547 [Hypholoma sublateritium FD-334 SS-4]|uniref:N-alpha-acetyltransferase 40 n=1 Tax=Hypholoma sublateritium (strain FD-334 SS-4) TaxID=945553 RepID=A0A0D2QC34_HYPSF|nr:hypothetical protein HYPSUDRAFT_32547 [Hypholoma sublateritium FD-334 SS-4]
MTTSSKAVKAANKVPSARLAALVSTAYEVASRTYPLQVAHSRDLKRCQREAIWSTYETNMYDFSKTSSFGWDPEAKRKELFHSLSRYILVTDPTTNELLAYTSFRYEVEEDEDILYCYELQVAPSAQGKGFGKKLTKELEKLCQSNNMEKIVLTVLKANAKAVSFYKAAGFKLDPTSPDFMDSEQGDSDEVEEVDYQILSKPVANTC